QPRSESIAEEVEPDVRIHPFALSILAVDDLCLAGMQLQAAFRQASLKLGLEGLGFLRAPTVHQPVIRIPAPREVGVCPSHPEIKCVVQEQIRLNWANHAPLRGSTSSLNSITALLHRRR